MKKNDQIRALIDAYTELAECSGCSERSTMLALFDIFDSDELVELGYGERVKAYDKEYGNDEEDGEEVAIDTV